MVGFTNCGDLVKPDKMERPTLRIWGLGVRIPPGAPELISNLRPPNVGECLYLAGWKCHHPTQPDCWIRDSIRGTQDWANPFGGRLFQRGMPKDDLSKVKPLLKCWKSSAEKISETKRKLRAKQ